MRRPHRRAAGRRGDPILVMHLVALGALDRHRVVSARRLGPMRCALRGFAPNALGGQHRRNARANQDARRARFEREAARCTVRRRAYRIWRMIWRRGGTSTRDRGGARPPAARSAPLCSFRTCGRRHDRSRDRPRRVAAARRGHRRARDPHRAAGRGLDRGAVRRVHPPAPARPEPDRALHRPGGAADERAGGGARHPGAVGHHPRQRVGRGGRHRLLPRHGSGPGRLPGAAP